MKSNEFGKASERWRTLIRVMLGCAMGFALAFSLGIVGRNASSSRPQRTVAVELPLASEASGVAAQGDSGASGQRLPGHPELDLQLD